MVKILKLLCICKMYSHLFPMYDLDTSNVNDVGG